MQMMDDLQGRVEDSRTITVGQEQHSTCIEVKNVVFWDVTLCIFYVNRRFGGTYRLYLQDRKIRERGTSISRYLQTEFPTGNNQLYKNTEEGSVDHMGNPQR
jgi:hypothetical protein